MRQTARGLTNQQIAIEMKISCATVNSHVLRVLRKIGLTDRTQAALWAMRNNLV
jgi:DNA-binding NarL/FixJ family response regulator